jgi:hypothetical protein
MNLSGEPKETAVSREIMPADGSDPAQRNERGFRHVPAYDRQINWQLISHRWTWQRVRIAVIFPSRRSIASVRDFLAGPLNSQLLLDHAPQQADEMCHDLGVCRVFKGIPVSDLEARSRAWVTS